ncbi:MAG: recombination protein RecR [Bacteroidetes bacterium]|nr:recombination protein RecR [Bacteroidota bacterium]
MPNLSRWIEDAADQVATLPGIGKKTALRLVLHMIKKSPEEVAKFAQSIVDAKVNVKSCQECHQLSDDVICEICKNPTRNKTAICVVQDIRDVLAVENTGQFNGLYHVLGGLISPMEGISPSDLHVDSLLERIQKYQVQEVILALNATMEGETTSFYLYRKLSAFDLKISNIARGVAVGGELEYTDEVTLGRSIIHRTPYESTLKR